MTDNKNSVRLGEGVTDNLKQSANQEISEMGKMLIGIISKYAKEKIQGIDFDKLFSKKNEQDLLNLWANQLVEKGLISKVYVGLPENLLIDNLHQESYLEGMYVGYALAMMSLIDNGAPEDLLLAVRDDIRPNLMWHHYNDRNEFVARFENEKYSCINSLSKKDAAEKLFF